MTYSCSDLADDAIRTLGELGMCDPNAPELNDNPGRQSDLICEAIENGYKAQQALMQVIELIGSVSPIFILDEEQPTRCSKCSTRTDLVEIPGSDTQIHACRCGNVFVGEVRL